MNSAWFKIQDLTLTRLKDFLMQVGVGDPIAWWEAYQQTQIAKMSADIKGMTDPWSKWMKEYSVGDPGSTWFTLTRKLQRGIRGFGESTLGRLSVEKSDKNWWTLEPGGPDSTIENSGKRISAGIYRVVKWVSPNHKNVYKFLDVDGRVDVLFHSGNFIEDTLGCPLPGMSYGLDQIEGGFRTYNSGDARDQIFKHMNRFDSVFVEVVNDF